MSWWTYTFTFLPPQQLRLRQHEHWCLHRDRSARPYWQSQTAEHTGAEEEGPRLDKHVHIQPRGSSGGSSHRDQPGGNCGGSTLSSTIQVFGPKMKAPLRTWCSQLSTWRRILFWFNQIQPSLATSDAQVLMWWIPGGHGNDGGHRRYRSTCWLCNRVRAPHQYAVSLCQGGPSQEHAAPEQQACSSWSC